MAKTLVGKVKSLSVTVKGGSAMTITGVRTAELSKNFGVQEDYDPDDEKPYHWQGNISESIALTMRDYQLALELWDTPCVTALSCVLNAPRSACATTDTTAVTITGTNLVADGEIKVSAAPDGKPTEYTVTFKVSHVDGTAGSLALS